MLLNFVTVMYVGTDKPNITLLNNHVRRDAAPQWHKFGEQLLKKVVTHKLDVIEEKNQNDVKECCSQLFSHWLDNFEATWNMMIRTLEQRGHTEVVTSVKRDDTINGY